MADNAAVVVRAPAVQPNVNAGWNLKIYLPRSTPNNKGMVVAATPTTKSIGPTCSKPFTKLGPEDIPTTAIKVLRPILLKTHIAGSGKFPNTGCFDRSQPNTRPAIKTPPLVLRLSGTPPIGRAKAPNSPPKTTP